MPGAEFKRIKYTELGQEVTKREGDKICLQIPGGCKQQGKRQTKPANNKGCPGIHCTLGRGNDLQSRSLPTLGLEWEGRAGAIPPGLWTSLVPDPVPSASMATTVAQHLCLGDHLPWVYLYLPVLGCYGSPH